MLEIKFINNYLKKLWILLSFIFIYQFITMIFFIVSVNNLSINGLNMGSRSIVNNFRNFDLILLGIFVFPIIIRFIKGNEFYKNYLLQTQKHFKSNLIIIFYFILLMFIVIVVKKIIFYPLDHYLINRSSHSNLVVINFELAFFADLHLVVVSLFIGKILSVLPIRKNGIFYPLLILITLFIILFIVISSPIFLLKLDEKQSTDILTRQTINIFRAIKSTMIWIPLIGWIVPNQIAEYGGNFYDFLNYNNSSIALENHQLDSSVAIWIIISFFVYLGFIVLFCYINKPKIIILKNAFNFNISRKNK